MSDDIPADLVDKMMVKCARRCCICRRFRPTKLQVHHILERGKGGDNEEDNSSSSASPATLTFTRKCPSHGGSPSRN
jgi:hypothetical protein